MQKTTVFMIIDCYVKRKEADMIMKLSFDVSYPFSVEWGNWDMLSGL